MRICRFTDNSDGEPRFGVLEGESVIPLRPGQVFSAAAGFEPSDEPLSLGGVRLLTPVAPSKIVCVGRNYREHAAELGNPLPSEPLLFLKAPSAIIASGETIH